MSVQGLVLSNDEKNHCAGFLAFLQSEINSGGPLAFHDYMNHALYHTKWGYYRSGKIKIGEAGDFTTAPEISDLFSFCLARQCIEIRQAIGDHYSILECGAGRGTMALSILEYLSQNDRLPKHYYILELSGHMKALQKELILSKHPEWAGRVQWLSAWPQAQSFEGMVLANELFDAMPVHLFRYDGSAFLQAHVSLEDGQLSMSWPRATPVLESSLESLQVNFSKGYQSEWNPSIDGWLGALASILKRGALIAMDYGFERSVYYHPDRMMGTLMCHYKHQAHTDPLLFPGCQDITSHVDFTHLSQAAKKGGWDLQGFVSQANGLINAGLMGLISSDMGASWQQKQAMNRLVHPAEMGELFSWIGVSQGLNHQLSCFSRADRSHRL